MVPGLGHNAICSRREGKKMRACMRWLTSKSMSRMLEAAAALVGASMCGLAMALVIAPTK